MALSAERRRYKRGNETLGKCAAAASQNIYRGALVGANAAGACVPMSDAAGVKFLGIATKTYLSTAATTLIEFAYGHEEWLPILSGTVTAANITFQAVAVADDGITDAATATFDRACGKIVELETKVGVAGAWVSVRTGMESAAIPGAQTASGTGPLRVGNIPIGAVAYGSLGTSAVHVAGSIYVSEIAIPQAMRVTGIGMLNGATVGTDNLIFGLYASDGTLVANTALAGTLSAGTNAFQEIALTAAVDVGPGRYFLATQCNGTTATTRRIAASTYLNRASVTAGSFGTLATITAPTTTTADAGPIGYVY
ncbi:MAG: hypothetical protein KA761_08870 [Gemmatimonadaceae bacterium]|nr:hypothetical protein [Gemmatimonadaceae bacterium]